MLTQIDLRYFKCFELLHLPLRPLTLLSGPNASGKSSVLQSLALLHQTMREHEWSTRLMLNGMAVRLGTVLDIVDKVHSQHRCEIGLIDEDTAYHWTFKGARGEMSMAVERVAKGDDVLNDPKQLRYLLPPDIPLPLAERVRDLTYLTAERIGPRESYDIEDPQIAPVVGPAGEHAVSVLYSGRDEYVRDELVLPDVPATRLRQVEARMRTLQTIFQSTGNFPICTGSETHLGGSWRSEMSPRSTGARFIVTEIWLALRLCLKSICHKRSKA